MQSKICGVKDSETLNFLINYKYPPELIGFICNYPKSKRFVDMSSLQKLLKVDNQKSRFVSVLVKPDEFILNEMQKLNFEYFQIYDCTPDEIKSIKKKYNKIVISPGPGNPNQSGNCLKIVRSLYKKIPILGVCLGHQIIGQVFGSKIIQTRKLMHLSLIHI